MQVEKQKLAVRESPIITVGFGQEMPPDIATLELYNMLFMLVTQISAGSAGGDVEGGGELCNYSVCVNYG